MSDAVARMLKYARLIPGATYDEICFRAAAANPRRAEHFVQSVPSSLLALANTTREATFVLALRDQVELLRHRPLEIPPIDNASFNMRVTPNVAHFTFDSPDEPEDRLTWSLPLTNLPPLLMRTAVAADVRPIVARTHNIQSPGANWLTLASLVEWGAFRKFQTCRDSLVHSTRPGNFYCFISHRWHSPTQPDPDGLQARFAAWQLVAHLAHAIRIASTRGLHEPRRILSDLGVPAGQSGTNLAESLIVNLLRPALTPELLRAVRRETADLDDVLDDDGVRAAAQDTDLKRLHAILHARPLLTSLSSRFFLWYDYSCLPQPPRTPDDHALFLDGINHLMVMQVLGHTVVLLDDAIDYLSRAWCTFEALTANNELDCLDLLVGSARPESSRDSLERHFNLLMKDRPHLVWRAILDTEVFRTQSPPECMRRLSLAATDPNDIPFIYEKLRAMRAPLSAVVNGSELLTGVFPLVLDEGCFLAPKSLDRLILHDQPKPTAMSLDWTGALRIEKNWKSPLDSPIAPLIFAPPPAGPHATRPLCHVALIASSEGEAVLWSAWLIRHQEEFQAATSVSVTSISWLAVDPCPVGAFSAAYLQVQTIDAPTWAVITLGVRLDSCIVTSWITNALHFARKTYYTLALDRPADNLLKFQSPPDGSGIPPPQKSFEKVQWSGGLLSRDPSGRLLSSLVTEGL